MHHEYLFSRLENTAKLLIAYLHYCAYRLFNLMALLNNFVIEKANFDGSDIGLLQSVREVPGFLSFTAVFVLLFIREQRFMLVSLAMLTLGTAITGYFPTLYGLLLRPC